MYIPDLSVKTYDDLGGDGFEYRSVGWLGDRVEREGDPDPTLVHVLLHIAVMNPIPNRCCGVYTCQICKGYRGPRHALADDDLPPQRVWDDPHGGGALFVEDGAVRYVLPALIFHYIIAHRYRLPAVVEAAVRRSAVLTEEAWEAYDRSLATLVEHAYPVKGEPTDRDAWRLLSARARMVFEDRHAAIAYQEASTKARKEAHTGGVAEGLARGKLRGARSALLRLLASAKVPLTEGDRASIQACADPETIDRWLERVPGARTAAEVLR
jgi:hypothetical protein